MTAPTPTLTPAPIGQMALRTLLNLAVPEPHVQSYVSTRARRTIERTDRTEEYYPASYHAGDTLRDHLRFTLRYEAFDLRVLAAAMNAMAPEVIVDWVTDEPVGAYSRRAWFLYEFYTGQRLPLPDTSNGRYVDALDSARHVTTRPVNSARHRVRDNLLGTPDLSLSVRRTPELQAFQARNLSEQARQVVTHYDTHTLARAVTYLYTKETRSSYDIEGETPTHDRFEQFVRALRDAPTFTATPDALVRLQRQIVDPRYATSGLRDHQNYVGEGTRLGEYIHYVCPKPEDVPRLMRGWHALTERLLNDPDLDPVVAAACAAFTFVLIHPYEDGNGRLHRFLIHHVLARKGFSPPGLIFPVSASILRSKHRYDEVLEGFSGPIQPYVHYTQTADWELTVQGDTLPLYRAFDATDFVTFLYARVQDTIERDLHEELAWIATFDQVYRIITDVVDMPDRQARTLTRYFVQEGGRLSRNKRRQFPELTDAEIDDMTRQIAALHTAPEEPHPAQADAEQADADTPHPTHQGATP